MTDKFDKSYRPKNPIYPGPRLPSPGNQDNEQFEGDQEDRVSRYQRERDEARAEAAVLREAAGGLLDCPIHSGDWEHRRRLGNLISNPSPAVARMLAAVEVAEADVRQLEFQLDEAVERELKTEDDLTDARAEIKRLQVWINDLQVEGYIKCVYCGHRFGPDSMMPATMATVLKEHIEQCSKHPLSKAETKIEELKTIIGSAAPLAWVSKNDLDGAKAWEIEAFEAIQNES